jgi:hypothetical protein
MRVNMRGFVSSIVALFASLIAMGGSPVVAEDGGNPIVAHVAVTNDGPLTDCPTPLPAPPPESCLTRFYLFVRNTNEIDEGTKGQGRDMIRGAYVVSSVDVNVTVDGSSTCALCGQFATLLPPPHSNLGNGSNWPMTVRCNPAGNCTVGKPAVLPEEHIAIVSYGWAHGANEADGAYVFTLTVHGTLDGRPVDASAHTAIIRME